VGIKGVEGGRVGRRYRRGAPAERTGSDRAAGAREGRAKPKREAERDTRDLDVGERVREAGETLKKLFLFPFFLLHPPQPSPFPHSLVRRGREVGIGREEERDTIKRWKGSAKGLVKRVLWVGPRGKGSLLRD
jgi:hypothetical protein